MLKACGFPMRQPCMWAFAREARQHDPPTRPMRLNKEGTIVGFVEVPEYEYEQTHGTTPFIYHTNVLVLAQTFCQGEILELPMYCVQVVDEFYKDEE